MKFGQGIPGYTTPMTPEDVAEFNRHADEALLILLRHIEPHLIRNWYEGKEPSLGCAGVFPRSYLDVFLDGENARDMPRTSAYLQQLLHTSQGSASPQADAQPQGGPWVRCSRQPRPPAARGMIASGVAWMGSTLRTLARALDASLADQGRWG